MGLEHLLGPDGATLVSGYCKDMQGDLRLYESGVGQLGLLMDLHTKSDSGSANQCQPNTVRTVFLPLQMHVNLEHKIEELVLAVSALNTSTVHHVRRCHAVADSFILDIEHDDDVSHFQIKTDTFQTVGHVLNALAEVMKVCPTRLSLRRRKHGMLLNPKHLLYYYDLRSSEELRVLVDCPPEDPVPEPPPSQFWIFPSSGDIIV